LRQEKKSSSPLSECRQEREEVLLAFERVKARLKVLSASRGGGDVHPWQVEAPEKVLLTSE